MKEVQKELYDKILEASNVIVQRSRRGSANNIIMNTFIYDKWWLPDFLTKKDRKEKIENLLNE